MASDSRTGENVGRFAGRHVLAELSGVDAARLDDATGLAGTLRLVLERAGATVCEVVSKRFHPRGVTVLALLAESHASVHTYPEIGSAFLDVFTCGHRADPVFAVRLLAEYLGATAIDVRLVRRGHDSPTADVVRS